MKFVFFLLAAGLMACNNGADTGHESDSTDDTSAINGPVPVITTASTPVNIQVDSVIRFKFEKDSSTLTATGTLHSSKDRIIGYLAADHEADLTVELIPSDPAMNIRLSQIVLPDGKTDGPFGQKLQYRINQEGTYQIIITPSNMASGKTSGDFTIRLGITPEHP